MATSKQNAKFRFSKKNKNFLAQERKLQKHNVKLESSPPSAQDMDVEAELWAPLPGVAFKALLSARLCAALWNNLSDCDETFNYWEPLHFLMHNTGLQTWEYSPQFSLRSYAYLYIHALPLKIYQYLGGENRMFEFFLLRCLLSLVCTVCELLFYSAIYQKLSYNSARLTLFFLLFSPGMFISSAAFLPSSFSMYMTMISIASWINGNKPATIISIAASAIIAWPFAAVIGLPIAFDYLYLRRKFKVFFKFSVLSLIVILVPLVIIDSFLYGRNVIAPLNIVMYNVFSSHGPELYGVEPWHFYFVNCFLNFNIVFPLALISLPFMLFLSWHFQVSASGTSTSLIISPLFIWIAIFFTRPHKEERFMFPVYPLICLSAALTLDFSQRLYNRYVAISQTFPYTCSSNWIILLICVIFAGLSVSRSLALYEGYHAPRDIYTDLQSVLERARIPPNFPVKVCVGKEWHRYQSTFFLPELSWSVQFIQSDFRGQLPKHYSSQSSSTRLVHSDFNDQNKMEASRFVNVSKCHFLVDLEAESMSELEPNYAADTKKWKRVIQRPYLINHKSNRILRAFFVPFLSQKYCSYGNYVLLQSNLLKFRRKSKLKHNL